jgi:hypothetical protein
MTSIQLSILVVAIIFIVIDRYKSKRPSTGIVITEYRSIEHVVTVGDVERLLLAEYYALEAQESLVRNEYCTQQAIVSEWECYNDPPC